MKKLFGALITVWVLTVLVVGFQLTNIHKNYIKLSTINNCYSDDSGVYVGTDDGNVYCIDDYKKD